MGACAEAGETEVKRMAAAKRVAIDVINGFIVFLLETKK